MNKVLLVPDTHFPFEDKKAWSLLLRVGKAFKPNTIVVMGDFVDCYTVSSFPKSRRMSLEAEINAARKGIRDLESLGAKTLHYLEGNHEARLPKYLAAQCSELFGLFPTMPQLLGLRSWQWHPYHDVLRLGKLHLSHDYGAAGPTAHMRAMVDVGGNAAHGHTHHLGIQYRSTLRGSTHFGAALGCLADKSKVDYMNKAKVAHWTPGCGLGYLLPNGNFHLIPTPFVRGVAIVDGQVVG